MRHFQTSLCHFLFVLVLLSACSQKPSSSELGSTGKVAGGSAAKSSPANSLKPIAGVQPVANIQPVASAPAVIAAPTTSPSTPTNQPVANLSKPQMGYATYYNAAYGRYYPTQSVFESLSDDMARVGMVQAGYTVFAMEGWRFASNDANGNAILSTVRAADGSLVPRPEFSNMAALATHIHKNGQLAGIYTDSGKNGCYGAGGGSGANIRSDMAQFISWGYDYLKLDHCGGNPNSGQLGEDGSFQEYLLWSKAIFDLATAKGKTFIFNIADWNNDRTPGWASSVGNSWRTGTDIDCYFGCNTPISWASILRNFDKNDIAPASSPGHNNDPDYLLIGMRLPNGQDPLTRTEEKSYFSMWAIQAAPLMLATLPSDLDPAKSGAAELRAIVFNSEVIAVDQDELGRQGEKVREDSPGLQVYSKVLSGSGQRAVLLLNRNNSEGSINVTWQELGLSSTLANVRDLWTHQELGQIAARYSATVPAHGVVMLRVTGMEATAAADGAFQNLGGKILGTPTVITAADGRRLAFGRGLDSMLWMRRQQNGAWDSWTRVSFPAISNSPAFPTEKAAVDLELRSEPSITVDGNSIHILVTGAATPYPTENEITVWHTYSSDGGTTWNTPENLGGNVYGALAGVYRDSSTFDVLGRGFGGGIWRKTYHNGWGNWEPLGGCLHSGVSASSEKSGLVHLAVVGCDDTIWHGYYVANGGINWEKVGNALVGGTPAIVTDPVNRLVTIFARNLNDSQVQVSSWNSGWSAWASLGGCAKNGVTANARPSGLAVSGASVELAITGCNSSGKVSANDPRADAVWFLTR